MTSRPPPAGEGWEQALDPRLLRRLWRRAERPGLSEPGLAAAILRRHRAMAAGLPLADALRERWAAGLDEAGAPSLALVYARPYWWTPPAAAGAGGNGRPRPEPATRPVVRASAGREAHSASGIPGASGRGPGGSPAGSGAGAPAVAAAAAAVDAPPGTAKPAPGPAAPASRQRAAPPGPPGDRSAAAVPPRVLPPPRAPLPIAPAAPPAPAGSDDGRPAPPSRADRPADRPQGTMPVTMAAIAASFPAAPGLPLVVPSAAPLPDGGTVRVDGAGARPAPFQPDHRGTGPAVVRPVVPVWPRHTGTAPAPFAAGAPRPPGTPTGTAGSPVVREQVVRERVMPGYLPGAAQHALAAPPAVGDVSTPGAQPSVHMGASRAVRPVRPVEASPPALPPRIDIDGIVDTVQRRLMRRLAIEGERRGMRPWGSSTH
jgi:hypothetical protein